jgi:hypothetical protein
MAIDVNLLYCLAIRPLRGSPDVPPPPENSLKARTDSSIALYIGTVASSGPDWRKDREEPFGGKKHPPYAPEFRRQMIELALAGRTPEELAKEFEPPAQAIRN